MDPVAADDDVLSSITTGVETAIPQRPPLLGRETEIKKLRYVWERVSSISDDGKSRSSEVVTVSGPSGVGKSYLIESFRSIVEGGTTTTKQNHPSGIFVSSKFDQIAFKRSSRREPFYAIVSALSDICEILKAKKEEDDASDDDIGKELRQVVGVEFGLLCQFIPTLHQLLSSSDDSSQKETVWERSDHQEEEEFRWDTTLNRDDSLSRICWAVTRLINVASSRFPILLHFDDVHWADTESLTLIKALIADAESKAVVIALSYRDGVESSKVVSRVLDDFPQSDSRGSSTHQQLPKVTFKQSPPHHYHDENDLVTAASSSGSVRMTHVRLSNLNKEGVQNLLSSLLKLDRLTSVEEGHASRLAVGSSSEGRGRCPRREEHPNAELVNLVFLKTSGNPFFVLQFLERLKLDGLLHYSSENDRWEWSDMEAMTRLEVMTTTTAAGDDVLGSIDVRMSQLPEYVRKALMIAAHLGFRFRRDVLETVLIDEYMQESAETEDSSSYSSWKKKFDHVLDSAERASLLLRVDKGKSFCFVHDRIQQCAYEMVPPGNSKRELYLNLGTRLLPMLKKDNSLYFLVADLLNHGSDMITEKKKRSELVKINKTAAEMSIRRAAYRSATHYLRCAIDFLEFEQMWEELYYDVTLSLHNGLALASSNCSEYETCHRTAETIAMNARCVADKHTANLASIHAFSLDGRFEESLQKGLTALSELGLSTKLNPSKTFLILRILRTRRALMKKSRSYMLSLPKMTDSKQLAILEIIGEISPSIYVLSNEALLLHLDEYMMATSLRRGWSTSTMTATVAFGLVEVAAFANVERAAELGNLALDMFSRYGKEDSKCYVVFMANSFLFPWTHSWSDCTQCLSDAFSIGMQHGKTFIALSCKPMIAMALRLTTRLTDAERDIRQSCETMKRFKVSSSLMAPMRICLQFVLNMMGYADNPAILSGEIMDEGDPRCLDTPITGALMRQLQFELACHFGELDRAYHVLKVFEEKEVDAFKAHCPSMVSYWFWSGMTYLGRARTQKSHRRKYFKRTKARLASLQKVVRDGCDDARPFHRILKAELASGSAAKDETMKLYDSAIEVAVETGFVGYAGVACERAYFFLERLGSPNGDEEARRYWDRMMEFYDDWGAIAKIELLRRTNEEIHLERKVEISDVLVRQKPAAGDDDVPLQGSEDCRAALHTPVLGVIKEPSTT